MRKKIVSSLFHIKRYFCVKRSASIILLLFLFEITPFTVLAHTADIEVVGDNQYQSVRLTPQVYNAANSDLSDLLIKDRNGENVPYFIHSGTKSTQARQESYVMELIQSYLKDDNFYFDYKLSVIRNSDTISTSIGFSTRNTSFAKVVDVYGSYDNIHWDFVQRDSIYSIDHQSKLTIDFFSPQKYTHFRLQMGNNLEQIAFDAVYLLYSVETSEETYFIETLVPRYRVDSGERRTDIVVEGLKNLRLCDITIHTDSMFQRNARTPQGISKEIFNLSFRDTSYSDTTIPLYWAISQDDTYTVTIADADDKPIQIDGITVRYYADEIVFETRVNEVYTLVFGANSSKTAPVYDIERYKNEILKGAVDQAALGEIVYETAAAPPERDYRFLFNSILVLITLLLGTVIVRKLKKK